MCIRFLSRTLHGYIQSNIEKYCQDITRWQDVESKRLQHFCLLCFDVHIFNNFYRFFRRRNHLVFPLSCFMYKSNFDVLFQHFLFALQLFPRFCSLAFEEFKLRPVSHENRISGGFLPPSITAPASCGNHSTLLGFLPWAGSQEAQIPQTRELS